MARPSVLLAIDRPDWTFSAIAREIAGRLGGEFDFTIAPANRCPVGVYDVAVALWWAHAPLLRGNLRIGRMITCLYDGYSWNRDEARKRFVASLKQSDFLAVANEMLGKEANAEIPVALVEDGVDCERFPVQPLPAEFVVGWCGRSANVIGDGKGVGLIRKACAMADVPLRTLDVGPDPQRPKAEMPAWYREIAVYVCASDKEGTPNPVLEAMASGRPVLTTRVGITDKLIRDDWNGRFFDRTPEALAEALAKAKTWDLRRRGICARRTAEEHDWKKKIGAWRELLWRAAGAAGHKQPMPPTRAAAPPEPPPQSEVLPVPQPFPVPPQRSAVRPGVRPRVLILCDVPNWAWARKAAALKQHLSDRFEIEIVYGQNANVGHMAGRDLYHTFECIQIGAIPPGWPIVTGITAHVWRKWENERGAGTVKGWADRCLGFHANSRLLERELAEYLGRPVYYVPNGVDEAFWTRTRERVRTGRLIVGSVARPNVRKGAEMIERACRLVGAEFRAISRRSHDALPADAVRDFYQDLDVLAIASDMDGTPNPALEAAACGVPIVSNRIGNMPEFIDHGRNGLLIERTVEGLTAAFGQLQSMPLAEIDAMGEAARRTVEAGWTWKRQAENYARMWSECLG